MSVERIMLSAAFVLAGCHGSNPSRGDGGGSDAGSAVTIQQVHGAGIAAGSPVNLAGVIVTAIDAYGARTGDIWVEEPAGGPLSGVHIYRPDPDSVAMLQVGDIVDVTNAIKANYAYSSDMTGRFDVELEPKSDGSVVSVTKTGTGTVPTPYAVDALSVGMMTDSDDDGDRSAQWAMFDGVLIVVNDVTQTSSIRQVDGNPPDPTLQQFDITGAVVVESDLAPFPTNLGFDACLTSVTGVLEYFLGYEILPRAQTEIQVASGAVACPPTENTPTLCSDGIDNDGNGYTDCEDNNCIITYATCSLATTIPTVDIAADANPTSPTLPTGAPKGVTIAGATITAVSSSGTSFWVAASGSAAADGGLYVYAAGQKYVAAADIGKTVDLVGSLQAYNNDDHGEALPELDVLATRNLATAAGGLTPSSCGQSCTAAALSADATGRPYVGSLVTLNNVKLTAAPTSTNDYTATLSQKIATTTTSFEGLSDIYLLTSPATTCYATLTGIWTYDVYNNVYALEPTAEGSSGGACL